MTRCGLLAALAYLLTLPQHAAAKGAEPASAVGRMATATCLSSALDELYVQNGSAVSISLAIASLNGNASWADAAGLSDRRAGTPATDTTGYRIASITKAYTAAAILRLTELGRLSVDDPIDMHLPLDYRRTLEAAGYDTSTIRIRHLLSHSSGLREHVDDAFIARIKATPQRIWTPLELTRLAAQSGPPLGKPGKRFAYSDTGYVLLGEIIERVQGEALPAAIAHLLNWPRDGSEQTWWEGQPGTHRRERAHQYWDGEDTYLWHPSFDLYGGGGLVATPAAVAQFVRALLRGEIYTRPATLAMQRSLGLDSAWNNYSAGLFEVSVGEIRFIGHSGFWNTFVFASRDLVLSGATGEKNAMQYPALLDWLYHKANDCGFSGE
jgi:D-alanyl-D-alanine carboxypeptidase